MGSRARRPSRDRPRARAAFNALSRTDQYVLYLPLLKARTPTARTTALTRILTTLTT